MMMMLMMLVLGAGFARPPSSHLDAVLILCYIDLSSKVKTMSPSYLFLAPVVIPFMCALFGYILAITLTVGTAVHFGLNGMLRFPDLSSQYPTKGGVLGSWHLFAARSGVYAPIMLLSSGLAMAKSWYMGASEFIVHGLFFSTPNTCMLIMSLTAVTITGVLAVCIFYRVYPRRWQTLMFSVILPFGPAYTSTIAAIVYSAILLIIT